MAKYTIDMMAAEMEVIAKRMRTAQSTDKAEILAQMDALALRSAQLTGQKAEELKARLDVVAAGFEKSSKDRFETLSNQLHDSIVDVLGNLQEIKAGQKRLGANQDSWGNRIIDGLRDLGNRIGSYVSTPAIIVEAIVAVIVGIVVGWLVKGGSAKVMEQIYDPDTKTAIMAVPQYTNWEQWGLAICFGVLAAIVLFGVCYGITKLVVRSKS